jgi:cytidylate kinase
VHLAGEGCPRGEGLGRRPPRLLKRFYEIDEELPTHYDLVVNTDVLTVEQAAELVSRAAMS